MGCPFLGKAVDGKGHGEGVKNVVFIGDVLNGCSLTFITFSFNWILFVIIQRCIFIF